MKNTAAGPQKYKHSSRVTWRRVGNEAVLLDLESSDFFSLNEVGMLIWDRIGSGASLDEIRTAIDQDYAAPGDRIKKDLTSLIDLMLKKKLLEAR